MNDGSFRLWLNLLIVLMGAVIVVIHESVVFRFLGVVLILQGGRVLIHLRRESGRS